MKLDKLIYRRTVVGALLGLASFAAWADTVSITIDSAPGALSLSVDGTNYTAPVSFDWDIGSAHTLIAQSPQAAPDPHTRYSFASWNDGGLQTNQITVPSSNATYTASFATQYLLDTAVAPGGSGTITNAPAGPWFNAGQVVNLTANTNTGYRFYFWQGADTATNNTAQVTMNGYHMVQAAFIPADYPYLVVTNNGGAAPGNLIGNIGGRTGDGTKTYYVVLDNAGTNLIYANKTNVILRFVPPQGFVSATGTNGFLFKDESLTNIVAAYNTLGYTLDTHDYKLFPNGHVFIFGTEVRTFDMSGVVTNGKTAAAVTGNVVQEMDANNRLVFEWHTFDHIAITNTFANMTQSSFDYAHINAMTIDPTDNNLLLSLRTTSEIVKVNRQTGEVIWRLGGKKNMFTYIGEHSENAPYYTVGQHDVHRLANGNLIYFDNGNISGGGVTPNDRTYSRMVEYALDETNMTATLVWEYRHSPDISAGCTGALKRMANGNTLINWGCAIPTSGYILTEVNPAGQVVFEMRYNQTGGISSVLLGGGVTKQVWNSPDLVRSSSFQNIQSGLSYTSVVAGVSATVNSLIGPSDSSLVVERHLDAVRLPQFSGKAPQVPMEHVILSSSNVTTLSAQLALALPDSSYVFDTPIIHNPSDVTVYFRPTPGQGQFTPLATTWDSGAQTLNVGSAQLGEFIFGYPDVSETPFVPAILSPVDLSQINQSQPVTLSWVPQGLVGSFDLQVATNSDFTDLVVNLSGLGTDTYAMQSVLPNTQYFWRVRTVNQGGTSDWADASFTTVPPVLHITFPVGGEVWQRFQAVTIRWNANISGNVALDMYLNGVSNRTFAASTPASSGSYAWTVGQFQAFTPATNYTIRIRSLSSPSLFDVSSPFSIVQPVSILTAPTGLVVNVDGTNFTAPASFAWPADSSHTIAANSPQVSSNGQSRFVFASWSDAGAQSHSITAPITGATNTARFSTNYLLDVAITPPSAGTVNMDPVGPWFDVGQTVSLTANANADYFFYSWQGVANPTNNTASVAMNSYKAVQATFIPMSGVPLISLTSLTRLPDGRIQFDLTAGAGVATQATIWAATSLAPPNWQVLDTVTLTNGSGTFVESSVPTAPARFYRVSLP